MMPCTLNVIGTHNNSNRGHQRTESGNIWDGEEDGSGEGGGGGVLNSVMHARPMDGNDSRGFFGAMKTAQVRINGCDSVAGMYDTREGFWGCFWAQDG